MIGGLPLSFAEPLLLLGLFSLPIVWWLLRVTPPHLWRVDFPPTRLLFDMVSKEETPLRTPWWLTALRLIAAVLVIFAIAGPVWNPQASTSHRNAPLVLLLDDGWSAAANWEMHIRSADELIAGADRDRRGVALIPLSEPTRTITLTTANIARVALHQLSPKPYAVKRNDALPEIQRFLTATHDADIVWLSDGIDTGHDTTGHGNEFINGLAKAIQKHTLTLVEGGTPPTHALGVVENTAAKMSVKILRASSGSDAGVIRAIDQKGAPIGQARFLFSEQNLETEASFNLPVELRNDIARLEIVGERSAGAVQLLDKRWRRRTIGIVSGSTNDTGQPLLASTFYLTRALAPFADIRLGEHTAPAQAIAQFLDQNLPMIVLADVGTLSIDIRDRLTAWIDQGGVLVRFVGPRLGKSNDDLVPVKLRRNSRSLGGSLTWEKPQHLATFPVEGPFAGLNVPKDITVNRQVLAEPDSSLVTRSWALLTDGTPLVTGEHRHKGMVVLFHVSADMSWSNLPLSGTFVEMLHRLVDMSGYTTHPSAGVSTDAARVFSSEVDTGSREENATKQKDRAPFRLNRSEKGSGDAAAPIHILDGFGAFVSPPATARPISADYDNRATADHPPGFYGPPEASIAVNTLVATDQLAPLDTSMLKPRRIAYTNTEPLDLRGILLTTALGLFLLDTIIMMLLGGSLARFLRRRAAAVVIIFCIALTAIIVLPSSSFAQTKSAQDKVGQNKTNATNDETVIKAVSQTHLAYVMTGNADVDSIVKAGMAGLTLFLAQRTTLEAGEPIAVDPARDELAFYPLVYWPVLPGAPKPSQDALNHLDAYMKQGGTVLFDTRDAIEAPPVAGGESQTPGMQSLRGILSSLDIPELEVVQREHVLTKTFYLLHDFPGRFNSGQTWVEALPRANEDESNIRPAHGGDGVSPIIITSNDLAGAWAIRSDGQLMLPLLSDESRQREFAFRAGVNIVMYTLTGNYKADQVHAPALIERLGQ